MTKSYVYLIQEENKWGNTRLKLGKGNNPTKRLRTLQTGNPNSLILLGTIECESSEKAHELEGELHKRFKEERGRGEWFNFTNELHEFIQSAPVTFGNKFTKYHYSVPMKVRKKERKL